eukprot:scaffold8450_cov215-Amphora_coffeaeformis.AAC.14
MSSVAGQVLPHASSVALGCDDDDMKRLRVFSEPAALSENLCSPLALFLLLGDNTPSTDGKTNDEQTKTKTIECSIPSFDCCSAKKVVLSFSRSNSDKRHTHRTRTVD